ncbi:hypothetical protein BTJ39_02445 [Izhakiella australiensis]|uniref:Uncharacterized protein n=1 Tax=Izhakiella australiensis TaxID=1926881 RepID=A0A1S8YSH7_9GAMM|nr:Xaa-Pro peptidase family protein [Izhakiella australiensis]OON42034.1 hypothetical protein BTJ39_02445 [Izhakiella australiensis]
MDTENSVPGRPGLAFTPAEYQQRVSKLRQTMMQQRIDVLLIDEFEHLAYFTGHVPTAAMYQCCLLPLSGDPVMIIRSLDAGMQQEMSWVETCVAYADNEEPLELVAAALRRYRWDRLSLGVEMDSNILLPQRLARLKALLPQTSFVDFSRHMWEQRLYKSPREIDYLRRASEICDSATLAGVRASAIGVNERDVAAAIYSSALRSGADNTRLLLMQSGPRSNILHAPLGQRVLQQGDVVHIEMVPHYRCYTARLMRPVLVGEPEPQALEIAARLIALQDAQFAAMQPGVSAAEIDAILRQQVLTEGLRDSYSNISGYSLGLVCIPRTSDFTRVFLPDSSWTLQAGMVFHMYTSAQGLAFSETILITDRGAERLTQLERRAFIASEEI